MRYVYFLILCNLYSCTEGSKEIPRLSEKEGEWKQPVSIELKKKPVSSKASPVTVYIDTFNYVRAGKPQVEIKGNYIPLHTSLSFVHAAPVFQKIKTDAPLKLRQKYIQAGTPVKVKAGRSIRCKGFEKNVVTMGIEDGLPSSQISALWKSREGNRLWIGTDNGLVLYDGASFYIYTVKEGLCGNVIFELTEDREGRLWIATTTGLCVFDGQGFLHFGTLLCNSITSLLADKSGNMWIGTCSGLSVFDGSRFTNITTANGLCDDYIRDLAEDYRGRIWIGTNKGFMIHNGRELISYPAIRELWENSVPCFKVDDKDNMWIGMISLTEKDKGGIWVFNAKDEFANLGAGSGLLQDKVYSIQKDKMGRIWLGNQAGVTIYDGKGVTVLNPRDGVGGSYVYKIITGDRNQMLIGTNMDGLQIIDYDGFSHYYPADELFFCSSFIEDKQGRIWTGNYKTGIRILDSNKTLSYTTEQGLNGNNITCMVQDNAGKTWIGTDQGIQVFDGKGFLTFSKTSDPSTGVSGRIFFVYKDRKGNIWIGTTKNGIKVFDGNRFFHFTKNSGLSSDYITAITEDSHGNIWLGTKESGISMYDGEKFTHYTVEEGLIDNYILSLCADRKGRVWIGARLGLSCFDQQKFTNYSVQEGLCDNAVNSIILDTSSRIWAGTGQGISCIKEAGNAACQIVNYRHAQGLCRVDCNQQSAFADSRNRLWWGFAGMISKFEPDKNSSVTIPPNAVLTRLDIMGRMVQWVPQSGTRLKYDTLWTPENDTFYLRNSLPPDTGWLDKAGITCSGYSGFYNLPENLALPFDQNHLTFHFSAFTLSGTNDVQYRYMLTGLENKWSIVSENNEADYRNIPPGTYRFKVQAKTRNSSWSKETEFTFRILSPWWKTAWAYAGYVACAVLITFIIIRLRTIKLQKDKKHLEKIIHDRSRKIVQQTGEIIRHKEQIRLKRNLHDTLGGVIAALRLNFEALDPKKTAVQAKEEAFENSKRLLDEAYAGIKDLSMDELLEDRLNKDFVNNVSDLLVKAKANFGFETKFQSTINEQLIPPEIKVNLYMILKEAITNCVTHSGGKQIIIRMAAENGSLHVLVVDDGKGFTSKNGTQKGNGLKNMKIRVSEMNGTFSVLSEEGEGTALRIVIPIQKQNEENPGIPVR